MTEQKQPEKKGLSLAGFAAFSIVFLFIVSMFALGALSCGVLVRAFRTGAGL